MIEIKILPYKTSVSRGLFELISQFVPSVYRADNIGTFRLLIIL